MTKSVEYRKIIHVSVIDICYHCIENGIRPKHIEALFVNFLVRYINEFMKIGKLFQSHLSLTDVASVYRIKQ